MEALKIPLKLRHMLSESKKTTILILTFILTLDF